jgi:hypothetical protein
VTFLVSGFSLIARFFVSRWLAYARVVLHGESMLFR